MVRVSKNLFEAFVNDKNPYEVKITNVMIEFWAKNPASSIPYLRRLILHEKKIRNWEASVMLGIISTIRLTGQHEDIIDCHLFPRLEHLPIRFYPIKLKR